MSSSLRPQPVAGQRWTSAGGNIYLVRDVLPDGTISVERITPRLGGPAWDAGHVYVWHVSSFAAMRPIERAGDRSTCEHCGCYLAADDACGERNETLCEACYDDREATAASQYPA